MQGLVRKSQKSELSGCCAGPVDFVQSYGMQHEAENTLSGVTINFFPENLGGVGDEQVKYVTKTLWLWKSCIKASGPLVLWQTIAGL